MNHASLSYERSNIVRENLAHNRFKIETVMALIEEAADLGDRSIQLHQEETITLKDYPAAQALEAWLDTNGYRYVWQIVYVPKDLLHPNSGYEYEELEIRW